MNIFSHHVSAPLNDNIVNMNMDILLPLAPDPPTSTNRYLRSARTFAAAIVETIREIEFIVATSMHTLCSTPL